jgi:regulator of cell morphogenesis and NO signaling
MNQDHRAVCDLVERLRTLTGGYQPPADGCRTYHLCFAELAGFDADLSRHVHIEDHVLFPRALELEFALT